MDLPRGRRKASAEGGPARKTSLILSRNDIAEIKVRKQSANLLQLQQLQLIHQQQQFASIRQNQVWLSVTFEFVDWTLYGMQIIITTNCRPKIRR